MFFLKGWCPRCDIFKLTRFERWGKSGHGSGITCFGRRSKLRVFAVFKGEEKLFKGCKTTWKKGRWSLVVGCFFFCGGLFFLVVGWEGEEGKAK